MKAATTVALLFLAACSKPSDEANQSLPVTEDNSADASAVPAANFEDHEADKYFYVSAVSEEDRKKGKAVGDVTTVRYLGENGGVYRLELLGDAGQHLATAECKRPCRITKTIWNDGSVTRLGYSADSILGSAFEDAFNGHLVAATSEKAAEQRRAHPKLRAIPTQFLGEWNEKLADCGTDNNDTRLRISSVKLHFYESVADVQEVTVQDNLTVTVKGSFSGEGETWSDTYKMSLRPSGNELVTGDLIRKRCT